jgi:enoyl-[acyl-carrier-protein] reductase (NADH)
MIKHRLGSSENVTHAAVFLTSDQSRRIAGNIIPKDGWKLEMYLLGRI